MKAKRDSEHIFTMTCVSGILAKGVSAIAKDANDIAWHGADGDFCVVYDLAEKRVTLFQSNMSETQFYALIGFCGVHDIDFCVHD